jgi:hypothetical protein
MHRFTNQGRPAGIVIARKNGVNPLERGSQLDLMAYFE